MLTGRFQLAAPGEKLPPKTAVILGFGAAGTHLRQTPPRGRTGAAWLPADEAGAEIRYRDPSQMGKVYLLPTGVARPVAGLRGRGAGPGRGLTRADARGLARADPAAPGRAEVAPPKPGLRRRDRQRLQRRDPARGASSARSASARPSRPRRSTRCTRRPASTLAQRDRRPAGAGAADVRETGSRLPGGPSPRAARPCPRCGTRLSEVELAQRGDDLVSGLPALRSADRQHLPRSGSGSSAICPT